MQAKLNKQGADIPDVKLVIQFGVPTSLSIWNQRYGRAGRSIDIQASAILLVEKSMFQRKKRKKPGGKKPGKKPDQTSSDSGESSGNASHSDSNVDRSVETALAPGDDGKSGEKWLIAIYANISALMNVELL